MHSYIIMPLALTLTSRRLITPKTARGLIRTNYITDKTFREATNKHFGFVNVTCNWGCDGRLNNEIFVDAIEMDGNIITIKEIRKDMNHYCRQEPCKTESMRWNCNSAHRIMKMHNLDSLAAALVYIKEHNKSPFYANNHKTSESYAKFQARNGDAEKWNKTIEKANFSRSLEGMQEKYGEELGTELYADICTRKGITRENFVSKYGQDIGNAKYDELVRDRVTKNGSYYGTILYTHKNEKLDSKFEYDFYQALCKYGMQDEYVTQVYYGGKFGYKSDFYIPKLDTHIEIAGMMQHEAYANKMKKKKELYGDQCIIANISEFEKIACELKCKLLKLERKNE